MNKKSNGIVTRAKWVDIAKCLAIIAVLIDHTKGILYTNHYVAYLSYYSVSLFIIVMGITTMWSYSGCKNSITKKVMKRCFGIIRPYIVATVVYGLFIYGSFDLELMLRHIVRFDMSPPFYYVLLYLQLVLISPVVFLFIESDKKGGCIIEALGFILVLWISSLTTNYSNILGVYGGGGKLFGGTYLALFYLGMWVGKYYERIHINMVVSGICALIMCSSTIAWWYFISDNANQIDSKLPFGPGFNPPSISFGLYALLIASTLFFLEMFFRHFPKYVPQKLMNAATYIGKHTLYIFLYHRFFLDIVFADEHLTTSIFLDHIWVKRFVFFSAMIIGSLLIEYIFEKIHKKVLLSYN